MAVGGTCVGTVNPGLVGGRVDVTKAIGASDGDSTGVCTQAVKSKRISRANVMFFFMSILYGLAKSTVK